MFANKSALKTLVMTDPEASDFEKRSVMDVLERRSEDGGVPAKQAVISFDDTMRMLGMSSHLAVSRAISRGLIKGWYGGPGRKRAHGVLLSSVESAIASAEKENSK